VQIKTPLIIANFLIQKIIIYNIAAKAHVKNTVIEIFLDI